MADAEHEITYSEYKYISGWIASATESLVWTPAELLLSSWYQAWIGLELPGSVFLKLLLQVVSYLIWHLRYAVSISPLSSAVQQTFRHFDVMINIITVTHNNKQIKNNILSTFTHSTLSSLFETFFSYIHFILSLIWSTQRRTNILNFGEKLRRKKKEQAN